MYLCWSNGISCDVLTVRGIIKDSSDFNPETNKTYISIMQFVKLFGYFYMGLGLNDTP